MGTDTSADSNCTRPNSSALFAQSLLPASSGPMCWRTSSTNPGSSSTPSFHSLKMMRTLVCCTCKAGEQHHLLPPASLSLLTSRQLSSRRMQSWRQSWSTFVRSWQRLSGWERQEAVRLLQEALRKADKNERPVDDEVVAGSLRLAPENKDIVEHKTENGCEEGASANGGLVNGSGKSGTCESNELPNDVSHCVALAERQDMVERQALVRLLLENKKLRAELLELESEMVGARLDNVYLDKELAGRIQQIQLLLATKTPADRKEKMWSQIESEMCLQRSKTIAQMCKTKQEVKCRMREESSRPLPTSAPLSLEV